MNTHTVYTSDAGYADAQEKTSGDITATQKAKKGAEDTIANLGSDTTSMVGLEKPLITLKNPGLYSVPIGFLAVILGSLLFGRRDRRAEDMWDELYVRSNTGLGRAAAVAH